MAYTRAGLLSQTGFHLSVGKRGWLRANSVKSAFQVLRYAGSRVGGKIGAAQRHEGKGIGTASCESRDKTQCRTGTWETWSTRWAAVSANAPGVTGGADAAPLAGLCNQEIMPAATIMSPWRSVPRAIDGGRCPGTPLPVYRARIGR
jgi:hypothetical protein